MADNAPDPSKIKVFGKAVEGGKMPTGKKCQIKFKHQDGAISRSELRHAITFVTDGPGGIKPEIMWSSVADSEEDEFTAVAYFVPLKAGVYKVTARFNGRKLRPEPFLIETCGADQNVSQLLSKVTVHGRAWELGKAFTMNEFVVDCSKVQPPLGNLKVHVKGPERASANLAIVDNENGTFSIRYKPTSPGQYLITVKIADTDIPGSPFNVRVTEFLSS